MTYLEEAKELATHHTYSYGVCEYVYLAHGDKADEILKVGAENNLSADWVMRLSDLCQRDWISSPLNEEGVTDPIRRNLRFFERKEKKLPRKFLKGWL